MSNYFSKAGNNLTTGDNIHNRINIFTNPLSTTSRMPTTALTNSESGFATFWNYAYGNGETDLLNYAQGGGGGLTH